MGIRIVSRRELFRCPPIPNLSGELTALLAQIPAGRVTTFGDLAEALGDVSAARWVAHTLSGKNDGPWYRVVKRTGELVSTDPDRAARQREQLIAEGVDVSEEGRLVLPARRWCDFSCDLPLRTLAAWQTELAQRADGSTDVAVPAVIGGLDVSYISDDRAIAAYVEIEVKTGTTVFTSTLQADIGFPYLTGYLTFRELPIHLALIEQVRKQKPLARVILVDGAGQLHPRRSGIAVAVGVVADCVTVGVAKHRLCGRAVSNGTEPLLELNGIILGQSLIGRTSQRPLQISPGHGLSLSSAVGCVRAVWTNGRTPLPIREADALSRRVAKESAD